MNWIACCFGSPSGGDRPEEIHDYIARHDSIGRANHVLERIDEVFASLSQSPRRGSYPKELLNLGIREYREVFFKPYRIIYREIEGDVHVLVIADRRRDMRTLLERRLLRAGARH